MNATALLEVGECDAEVEVADAELGAEGGPGQRQGRAGKGGEDALIDAGALLGDRVDDLEVRGIAVDEAKGKRVGTLGRTVLDGEDEVVVVATEIEHVVAPGVEIGAAS